MFYLEYIKNNTSIFAGNKAFDIMFKASEHGYNGSEYQGINNKNFTFWITTFENVLTDIVDEYNPDSYCATEHWFKCLKIIINMYKLNNKQTVMMNFDQSNMVKNIGARDIDHYYLSISETKVPYELTKGLSKEEIFRKAAESRKL